MANWTNPLAEYGIYWDEIEKQPQVNRGVNDFMQNEVVPAWKANAPVRSGAYRASIKVTEKSTTKARGKVGATDPEAHMVEFGSAHNAEYAPAEKTAKQFGGYAHDKPGA